MSVTIALQTRSLSPGELYFHSTDDNHIKEDEKYDSELLKSLRKVFAPAHASSTAIKRSLRPPAIAKEGEEELCWNGRRVLWSVGGIPRRTWDFAHERQDIQWVCWAWFRPDDVATPHITRHPETHEEGNRTFGPFFQFLQRQRMATPQDDSSQSPTACRALVVFLRDIAKVLIGSGVEHTIHLPFLVQRAWPISPTGVLVQRAQDREELDEAAILGTPLLPTLFSLSSPLDEFKIVGCARSIQGGFSDTGTPPIVDPLPAARLHPSDNVLYVSGSTDPEAERLLVSHNHEKRRLTIWRYASRKPNNSLHTSDTDRGAKARERVLNDRLDRIPLGAGAEDSEIAASYGGPSIPIPPLHPVSRADLTSNMDRVQLGIPADTDDPPPGVGDSSMRPHVWLQHVAHLDLDDNE